MILIELLWGENRLAFIFLDRLDREPKIRPLTIWPQPTSISLVYKRVTFFFVFSFQIAQFRRSTKKTSRCPLSNGRQNSWNKKETKNVWRQSQQFTEETQVFNDFYSRWCSCNWCYLRLCVHEVGLNNISRKKSAKFKNKVKVNVKKRKEKKNKKKTPIKSKFYPITKKN